MILNIFYAFLGSLGFGILFNIRGRDLLISAIGGAVAWATYEVAFLFHPSETFALFIAAMVISIYAEIMARILKNPVTLFLIAAMIPLVPGGGMYYTTFQSVSGNLNASLVKGMETLFNAGAIAVAIVLVSSIAKILKKKKTKIIK